MLISSEEILWNLTSLFGYLIVIAAIIVLVLFLFWCSIQFMMHGNERQRKSEQSWREIKPTDPPAAPLPEVPSASVSSEPVDEESARANDAVEEPASSSAPVDLPFPHKTVVEPPTEKWFLLMGVGFIAVFIEEVGLWGAGFLCVSVFGYLINKLLRKHRLAKHGKIAIGRVVDLNIEETEGGRDLPTFLWDWLTGSLGKSAHLVYRFSIPEKPFIEYEGSCRLADSYELAMAIGKKVKVRYLPKTPAISTLADEQKRLLPTKRLRKLRINCQDLRLQSSRRGEQRSTATPD